MRISAKQCARDLAAPWWATEEALRVTDIPNNVPRRPDGKRVSVAATFRWTLAGLHGIRLRRFKIGGCWHTTKEELARWSAALTAQAESGTAA